jgi:hypothetical protein
MTGFLVAEPKDDGLPGLAGRRSTTVDADEARAVAAETGGQVYALEPVEAECPFPPVPVVSVAESGLGDWLGAL